MYLLEKMRALEDIRTVRRTHLSVENLGRDLQWRFDSLRLCTGGGADRANNKPRALLRQLTYTAHRFGAYELRPAGDEKELYRSSMALPIAMLAALAEIYKYKTPKSVSGESIRYK